MPYRPLWTSTWTGRQILTEIAAHAATLLVTFGVDDEPLLDVLTGRHAPHGRLPFDLHGR